MHGTLGLLDAAKRSIHPLSIPFISRTHQKCIRNTSFHMVLRSCMCCCWVKLLSPWRILWAAHPMSIWAYSGSECDWGTTVDILPYRRCIGVLEFINNDDLFRFLFGCTGDSVDSKGKQPRIVLRLYWRSYNIWDELAQISLMFGAQKSGPEISGTIREVITASLAPCLQKGAQSGEKSVVLLRKVVDNSERNHVFSPNYRLHVGCSGSVKNRWLPWLHSVYPIHPLPRLHLRGGAFPPSRCLQALDVHFAEANGRASSKTTGVMAERSLVRCRSVMICHDPGDPVSPFLAIGKSDVSNSLVQSLHSVYLRLRFLRRHMLPSFGSTLANRKRWPWFLEKSGRTRIETSRD